jgi:hypothetical protein
MAKKKKLPKFIIAEETFGKETFTWIVQLENPFLMARCEQMGSRIFRVYCWPPVAKTFPDIDKIIASLAEIWASLKSLPGLPASWEFVFDEKTLPPCYMIADAHHLNWSCVLRTEDPKCIVPLDDDFRAEDPIFLTPPRTQKDEIWRDALRFLRRYKEEHG